MFGLVDDDEDDCIIIIIIKDHSSFGAHWYPGGTKGGSLSQFFLSTDTAPTNSCVSSLDYIIVSLYFSSSFWCKFIVSGAARGEQPPGSTSYPVSVQLWTERICPPEWAAGGGGINSVIKLDF